MVSNFHHDGTNNTPFPLYIKWCNNLTEKNKTGQNNYNPQIITFLTTTAAKERQLHFWFCSFIFHPLTFIAQTNKFKQK